MERKHNVAPRWYPVRFQDIKSIVLFLIVGSLIVCNVLGILTSETYDAIAYIIIGFFFGEGVTKAREEGRINTVPEEEVVVEEESIHNTESLDGMG